MRHFLRDDDLTQSEQLAVIDRAIAMKTAPSESRLLEGRVVAILFDKPSTRTRVSFSVGAFQLGAFPLVLDSGVSQLGRGETVADTTRVLERQCDVIAWRTYEQERINEMASVARVPVINALTNEFHPCQLLADLMTLRERKGDLAGLRVAYLGDCHQNMAHSYLLSGATAGMHVRLAGPRGYQPAPEIVDQSKKIAKTTGGSVHVCESATEVLEGADAVVTDTWVSLNQEDEKQSRIAPDSPFLPFQVNKSALQLAKPDAIFLHCLPAYRGYEVTDEVIDGPQSVVWDEAENRLHAQKALMCFLLSL